MILIQAPSSNGFCWEGKQLRNQAVPILRTDRLGLKQIRTAFRLPWQNGFAERWISSLRRDCLDHVTAINEFQLRRVIRSYVAYYRRSIFSSWREEDHSGCATLAILMYTGPTPASNGEPNAVNSVREPVALIE